MKRSSSNEITRGQALSFRVPSHTPDHLLKHLQKLKETERRNFSSKIAEFVLQGVGYSHAKERETITVPLPHKLTKAQRDWLKHEHSEAILGSIIYQLLTDPVRSTSLLASLNSNSVDINEALYLQEEDPIITTSQGESHFMSMEETASAIDFDVMDDDLGTFDWEQAKHNQPKAEEENDEVDDDLDGLLGDFLAKMNK